MYRYIDDIFLTSNQSLHAINDMLDKLNSQHPNIKLVRQVGTSVSFLDVRIENRDGILATSVFHKEAAEPYIIPFNSDHPRHVFANIIENALLRVVRYSSTVSTFQSEQRALKLMLLYNGFVLTTKFFFMFLCISLSLSRSYPPRYIHNRFVKFFQSFLYTSTSVLPVINNKSFFDFVRQYLLDTPTISEHQIASRMARTVTDAQDYNAIDDPLVREKIKRKAKSIDNLIVHYTHEARLASSKKDIHQLWHQIFNGTTIAQTKLIVGNRNNRKCQDSLIRRRPHYRTQMRRFEETSECELVSHVKNRHFNPFQHASL